MTKLATFFENFLNNDSLFIDKKILQSSYTPENIPHRDEQINQIANILAPCLKLDKPSNLFIYGQTGTGKTLSVKHTTNHIQKIADEKNIPLKIIYVNCKLKKSADTEYRLIAQLAREMGRDIPVTGLPTDEVYNIFFKTIDETKQIVLLILDEIDQLVRKAGDELLYNLTRISSELKNAQIALIGISNDLVFTNNLDPRIKSSLSEEEIVFPPYNALQLKDILLNRSKTAFKDQAISEGVIEKCAAYAAREHGDARRALELLRVAGELAERSNLPKVTLDHIDNAEEKIEKDRILDMVQNQPKQFQVILYSIMQICEKKKTIVFTGDTYDLYKKNCKLTGLRPLTQRRISDMIAELDMLGIINAKLISKGRYGRTREITLSMHVSIETKVRDLLMKELGLI